MAGQQSQRRLGTEGLEVPAVGFGCMGLSGQIYGSADEGEAIAVIHRAIELGAGFLDTSDIYGPETNEEMVGRAIAGRRDEVIVATKFGGALPGGDGARGDAETIRASCDASLKRLGVDHIDLYYQHRVDFTVPVEETFGTLSELVDAGKVRYLGICEASADRIRRAHAVHPLSAVQTEYSLWSREVEEEILPTIRELEIGFVAYSPLGRGFLTGKITSTEDFAEGDVRRTRLPRFQAENLERNLALVRRIEAIADRHGATAGQVALAWVLARGEDIATIPGTKRIPYLEENVAAARLELSGEDQEALDDAFPPGVAAGNRYDDAGAAFIES
jgi:aryl-alcohol dehydrogenase-like predicted oxidoreductase